LIYTTQKRIWQLDMESRQTKAPAKTELKLDKPYTPAEECTF
jgi:hypothetical protein